jgi:hypothetical protein
MNELTQQEVEMVSGGNFMVYLAAAMVVYGAADAAWQFGQGFSAGANAAPP